MCAHVFGTPTRMDAILSYILWTSAFTSFYMRFRWFSLNGRPCISLDGISCFIFDNLINDRLMKSLFLVLLFFYYVGWFVFTLYVLVVERSYTWYVSEGLYLTHARGLSTCVHIYACVFLVRAFPGMVLRLVFCIQNWLLHHLNSLIFYSLMRFMTVSACRFNICLTLDFLKKGMWVSQMLTQESFNFWRDLICSM